MTLWLKTADGIVPVGGAYQTATPWTPATYTNSWADYSATYAGAEYRRLGDMIQLRGLVGGGTLGSAMFTLPVGFRPPYPMIFDVACKTGTVYVNSRLSITTAGAVTVSNIEYDGGDGTHYFWVSLDGIEFSITDTGQAPDYTQAPNNMSVLVQRSTGLSIPNAAATIVAWDAENFDTHGLHDNSTNNSRITIPTGGGGLWAAGFTVSFDVAATGTIRSGVIIRNGANTPFLTLAEMPPVAYAAINGSGIYRLNAGDYIECRVYQDSGAALNVRGNNTVGNISNFWAYRLGA